MELLSQYSSSSSSSESQSDGFEDDLQQLTPQQVRSVYLLTYSQADLSIFPEKESFAAAVCEAVSKCEGPKAKIVQWSCCQERHKKRGKHYHMAIKLDKIKRWLPIRQYLKHKWNVHVHFSNRHVNYYSAWLYTTKEDENFLQSPGHPDLINSGPPRTMSARQARAKRRRVDNLEDSATDSASGEDEVGEKENEESSASTGRGAAKKASSKRTRS